MTARLTPAQRDDIVALLRQGIDRLAIAAAIGVTPGQVSAIAAHLTMGTYENDDKPSAARHGAPSEIAAAPVYGPEAKPRAQLSVPIGLDEDTAELVSWDPMPQSGTSNPHLLIIGESGSGKTYATQCLCAELAQRGIATIVVDFGQGFTLREAPSDFSKFAYATELNVGQDGLSINPLQIFPDDLQGPVNVAQRIADSFARVYPSIGVQQHALLRDAILHTFNERGLRSDEPAVK